MQYLERCIKTKAKLLVWNKRGSGVAADGSLEAFNALRIKVIFITFELVTSNPGTSRKGNPWKEPVCDAKFKIKVFEAPKKAPNMTGSKADGVIPN